MNIHPIFVHFPVALFTVYSILELVRFKFILRQPYWFYVKAAMAIIGSAASAITYITGDIAGDLVWHDEALRPILSKHEFFAQTTVVIFGIIAACYLVAWINKQKISEAGFPAFQNFLWRFLTAVSKWILSGPVVVLAFVGLATVTITAGLGGAMVYGPDFDPFFRPIFHLIVGQ